jgi:hypothetical protein
MGSPETRVSLILRLPNAADAEAWNEFVALYRPLIFSLARGGGLQAADAEELRSRLEERGDELPEPVRETVEKELAKLTRTNPISPEYGVTRNYVLGLEDVFFVYPTKLREYQARYRGSFLHGGISPEEMILPVATLRPRGAR